MLQKKKEQWIFPGKKGSTPSFWVQLPQKGNKGIFTCPYSFKHHALLFSLPCS